MVLPAACQLRRVEARRAGAEQRVERPRQLAHVRRRSRSAQPGAEAAPRVGERQLPEPGDHARDGRADGPIDQNHLRASIPF